MNLEKTILNAIDLSRRLEAALKVDDHELCKDLLDIRGVAMADFESWHRTSTPEQINSCKSILKELVEADRSLQTQYKAALEISASDYRQAMSSGSGVPKGAYNTISSPACVDRKA